MDDSRKEWKTPPRPEVSDFPMYWSPRSEDLQMEMDDELRRDPDSIIRSPNRFYPYIVPPEEPNNWEPEEWSGGWKEDWMDSDEESFWIPSPKRQRTDDDDDDWAFGGSQEIPDQEQEIPDQEEQEILRQGIDDEETDFTQYYELIPLISHQSKKLHTEVLEFKATIQNSAHLSGDKMLFRFKRILKSMFQETIQGLKDNDYFRIIIQAQGLRVPISIAYTKVGDYDIDHIFKHVEKVLQSADSVKLDSSLLINVARTHWPEAGTGRASGGIQNRRIMHLGKWLKKKHCIIDVSVEGNICGFLAVIFGKLVADGKRYQDYRMKTRWQRSEADALAIQAGLNLEEGVTIDGMQRIQTVLAPQYQVAIYELSNGASDILNVLYRGEPAEKHIDILLLDAHYFVITSMKAFYSKHNYCYSCYKPYEQTHICSTLCQFCQSPTCQNRSSIRTVFDSEACPQCGFTFKTVECLQGHTPERCQEFGKCPHCELSWRRKKLDPSKHHCMERYCRSCRCYRPRFQEHTCYIPTGACYKEDEDNGEEDNGDGEEDNGEETASEAGSISGRKKPELTHSIWTVDFETVVQYGSRHYASILCIVQQEDGQEHVFEGHTSASDFVDFITALDYRSTKHTFLAHYAQGFDIYCFLSIIYEKRIRIDGIISRGQKITCLTLMGGRFRMIDSISFIQMPLASFSAAFSLREQKKGFYPYALLRCREGEDPSQLVERLKQPCPFPSRSEFDEQSMMPKRRREFVQFYEQVSVHNPVYNAWQELIDYCKSDVTLLRLGCLRFRSLYKEQMRIDVFDHITLTSANFSAFCKYYVPKDKISIVGDLGLVRGKWSKMACVWLEMVARRNMIEIGHAGNTGERLIGRYKVDGFSTEPPRLTYSSIRNWKGTKGTCFLFHGCQWHGCRKCCPDRHKLFMGETADVRYARTMRVEKYLRDSGYNVIIEWSCDFERIMKQSPDLVEQARLAGALHPRLLPRAGYFGGRVEPFCLHYKCKEGESIRYYDFNSLYPTVMLKPLGGSFYVGVPEVIRNNFKPISEYRGLLYGRFLAAKRDLFLPVLPCREDGRLFFSLCSTCSRTKNTEPCQHTREERAITTIVTTEELMLAIEKGGYEVLEVFEVWHYPPSEREEKLFNGFENVWMTLKCHSSDWPSSIDPQDDQAKQEYVDMYRDRFGIHIDPDKMEKNQSMRTVSKGAANSLYGRVAMKEERTNVSIVTDFHELRTLLQDPNREIKDIHLINDETNFVSWKFKDGAQPASEAINIVVCIQITSMARIMLYESLAAIHESPGCKLLYADTDSVVFAAPNDFQPPFECSDILGSMKDEIASDYPSGSFIKDWYCTGCKSYGFTVSTPQGDKSIMKMKGFRMDMAMSNVITPEAVTKMITEEDVEPILVKYPRRVARNMRSGIMKETDTQKLFRPTAGNKRIVQADLTTVPFGYVAC